MIRLITAGVCLLWGGPDCGGGPPQTERPPLSEGEIARWAKDAGSDPTKLVASVERVSRKDARRLLSAWIKLEKRGEKNGVGARFAKSLLLAARTPEEVLEVMGAGSPKVVVRQVSYRRYREQWIFEYPMRFCVVFDCVNGADPRVSNALALPRDLP
jgi:hypothetical protein